MSPVIGMLIGIAAIRRWPWSWPRMMPISWIIAWRSATIRFDHSQYPPALVGESLESPVTQDERYADLVFEMLDGAREGGLRHVAPGRGSTEVPFLLQCDQVLKLPQKHGGMPITGRKVIRRWSGLVKI